MKRICPWCRGWFWLPALLALSAIGMIGGCGLIQSDLRSKSAAALATAGVPGVSVDFDYRNGTLRGPESSRTAALAAVKVIDGPRDVTYIASDTAAATASIAAEARYDGTKVVLSGEVASEAQRTKLVTAAKDTYGAANVDDQLAVTTGDPARLDAAVDGLAATIVGFKGSVASARANLNDTTLTVTGRALTASGGATFGSLLDSLQGPGLTVTQNISGVSKPTAKPVPAAPPSQAPKVVESKLRGILRASTINFASGSATIETSSYAVLDRVAAVLRPAITANRGLRVRIQGHTDGQAAAAANLDLSRRRARAVKTYLAGKSITAANLSTDGFGETRPIASNATEAGRRTNRRIEFKVGG